MNLVTQTRRVAGTQAQQPIKTRIGQQGHNTIKVQIHLYKHALILYFKKKKRKKKTYNFVYLPNFYIKNCAAWKTRLNKFI